MKILKKIKELTEVDANLRVFYVADEENGGFKVRDDEITTTAISVISGQQAALVAARQEAADAKKGTAIDLTPLAEFGNDVASITASVTAKIEELTNAQSQGQKEVAKRIDDIKRQHSEALAAATATKDQEIASQREALHDYMLNTAIMGAANSWPGLNSKLVAPFARGHMAVKEIDGKPRTVIVDTDGQPRYSKNAERAGELMQADELLLEMSEQSDYKQLFPSKQADQGGGSQPRQTSPNGPRRTDKGKSMTSAQKISAGLDNLKK